MASFGSAFTGQDDSDGTGLKSIVTSAADSPYYKAAFEDPESRAALLQIGLGLMQPRALGQTPFGQIGQAIGAGGESVDRQEEADRKERDSDTKQQRADDALTIAELRLKNARNPTTDMTAYQLELLKRQDRTQNRNDAKETRAERKLRLDTIAEKVAKAAEARDSLVTTPETNAEQRRWTGKDNAQIEKEISEEYDRKIGKIPTDDELGGGGGGATTAGKPKRIKQNGYVYELQPDGTYK